MATEPATRSDGTHSAGRSVQTVPRLGTTVIMRSAWLLLAFVAALHLGTARAEMAFANLQVSAYVAPKASIEDVGAPDAVVLTAADLALGYKDVSARYRVSSNDAHGYLLQFSERAGFTRAIEVRGLGAPVMLGVFGATVPQFGGPQRAAELDLQYRLHLAAHARPGEYTLPVAVSAIPL